MASGATGKSMVKNPTHPSGGKKADTSGKPQGYLEIPLPSVYEAGVSVSGEPDLAGTRWLCFAAAALCAVVALWLPVAAMGAMDRLDQDDQTLAGVLVFMAMAVAMAAVVYLLRTGLVAGAWFRIDERGFGYGTGRSAEKNASAVAGTDIAWSQIASHPARSYDVGIATAHRAEVLAPRLTFWYRADDGALMERSIPLQLRDDMFRCLRFRNGHAVRVALLQGLAGKGLRFDPTVFVEAGVDPESWRPMVSPRRLSWLIVTAAIALVFLAVRVTWAAGWIVLCVLAILGLGYWATLAIRRTDPRLSRIIVFRPSGEPGGSGLAR